MRMPLSSLIDCWGFSDGNAPENAEFYPSVWLCRRAGAARAGDWIAMAHMVRPGISDSCVP